jgi:hypothetical protein
MAPMTSAHPGAEVGRRAATIVVPYGAIEPHRPHCRSHRPSAARDAARPRTRDLRRGPARCRFARAAVVYSARAGPAASANGLPSESRQTAQRSPGWITEPSSSQTRWTVAGRSATTKYGREAVSPGPGPREWSPSRRSPASLSIRSQPRGAVARDQRRGRRARTGGRDRGRRPGIRSVAPAWNRVWPTSDPLVLCAIGDTRLARLRRLLAARERPRRGLTVPGTRRTITSSRAAAQQSAPGVRVGVAWDLGTSMSYVVKDSAAWLRRRSASEPWSCLILI